jgi:NAD(P)-dependent dehydrogenase (short-subunit alcohol dehydrogenase family)
VASPLAGKAILVTGAARGIGEQVARRAAARGARVAAIGLEPDRLQALAADLGERHYWHEADVTDQAALHAAVGGAVDALGGLDAVVANAGIANMGTVAVSRAEALTRTIDVNLGGVVRTVSSTLPHLLASRGYYLLISSAAAFTALPGMAAYCAAKAGVEQFGNVLRLEVAHRGVQVGTAHPSWVDTDLVRDAKADLASFQTTLRGLPWPLRSSISGRACAEALVRAVEHRKRRVYVPRSVALVQALRTLALSTVSDRLVTRSGGGGARIADLEAEVRELGRFFGAHSAERRVPRAVRPGAGGAHRAAGDEEPSRVWPRPGRPG